MINKNIKIIISIVFFTLAITSIVFAENITMNFFYGINNVAKNGSRLPIELNIQNKDDTDFNGYALINVYESNRSVYEYKIDLSISANSNSVINKNISVANKINTISAEIYNNKEELIITERANIDLTSLSDRVIVGAITDNFSSLLYLDDIFINNNILRTKLVEINEEVFNKNKNVLDQIDILLISDINYADINDGMNYAINNFLLSGKPVIVSFGGENGVYTAPTFLYEYATGPFVDSREVLELNQSFLANVTHFDFSNSKRLLKCGENLYIESIKDDNSIIICTPFSFNELSKYRENATIFSDILSLGVGKERFDRIINPNGSIENNDFYNISNLLNIVDKSKLPDIYLITTLLVSYLAISIVVIYVYLRNVNKRERYDIFILIFAIFYTIMMVYVGSRVMKKNTFLTYISVVDIRNANTKENAFLNFRTSEKGSYSFNTSSNNKLYPIVEPSFDPILSADFIDTENTKYTEFYQEDNRMVTTVRNAADFDSNIFSYENSNYLNDIYNIDCTVKRFNGEVSGRVTNNMDIKINDAVLLMYGKVLKIGDIEPNHSITLSRADTLGVPIGNNSMLAEILGNESNQNIIKYYLDENIYGYYPYAMLFGFIDNNGTLDISSTDVGDVYGRTLIICRVIMNDEETVKDICSLEEEVNNISGYYDYNNNSINGDSEVINEYKFDNKQLISHVYFEEMTNYDKGNLNYNIPFYGDISAYNIYTKNYDIIYDNTISYENLYKYLSENNTIIIKFSPASRDPLYRKIALPIIRALGSK